VVLPFIEYYFINIRSLPGYLSLSLSLSLSASLPLSLSPIDSGDIN